MWLEYRMLWGVKGKSTKIHWCQYSEGLEIQAKKLIFLLSLSLCNVLIIVCLTTHLHVSVLSLSVGKDYICYNYICTTQRTVGMWVMPLTHYLWMSVTMAPNLQCEGNRANHIFKSLTFIAGSYCVLCYECDMLMTWSFDMVTESNFLPKLPPDDPLICWELISV